MMPLSRSFPVQLCFVSRPLCVCETEGQPLPEHQGVALKSLLPCQASPPPRGSEGCSTPTVYLLPLGESKLSPAPQPSLLGGVSCASKGCVPPLPPLQQPRAACSFSPSAFLALSSPTTFPGWYAGGFGHQGRQGYPQHCWEKQASCPQGPLARGKAKDLEMSPVY